MSLIRIALVLVVLLELIFWAQAGFGRTALLDEGYLHVRQAEQLLAGQGAYVHAAERSLTPLPLYVYAVAFASLALGMLDAFALVGMVLLAVLIALTFVLCRSLGVDGEAALFGAASMGSMPVLARVLVGDSVLVPLILSLALMLLMVRFRPTTGFVVSFVFVLCALMLTHPVYLLVVLAFVAYLFFVKVEQIKHSVGEFELVLFTLLLCSWFSLVIFRGVLFEHGTDALVGNVPAGAREAVSLLESLVRIGFVPFALGFYAIFRYVFRRSEKHIYLPVAMLLVLFFALGLGLIDYTDGVLFAGAMLCLLSAVAWRDVFLYVEKTHLSGLRVHMKGAIVLVLLLTAAFFASLQLSDLDLPTEADLAALQWLGANRPGEERVLGLYDEGNAIAALSGHPAVIDSSFLDVPGGLYEDASRIFTTYETEAVRLLNRHDVDLIVFSERAKARFARPEYLNNEKCFVSLYARGAEVYRVDCTVVET